MKTIDEVEIFLRAGKGGNGSTSFLREKFRPDGGPDGGNGGKGGDVIIKTNPNLNTLIEFTNRKKILADNGISGSGSKRHGKSGKNIILEVPVGTRILDSNTSILLHDLTIPWQEVVLLKGGKGGVGNVASKSSTNRSPKKSTEGRKGEEGSFVFSISTIADVGLIGAPNSGKSLLLSQTTKAKAKSKPYPFTTINPQIGFVEVKNFDGFMMVDIPGIIKGASSGRGMGFKFLRHIDRCKVLIHIIDCVDENMEINFQTTQTELSLHTNNTKKINFVALNKIDLIDKKTLQEKTKKLKKLGIKKIYHISAKTKENLCLIMEDVFEFLKQTKDQDPI